LDTKHATTIRYERALCTANLANSNILQKLFIKTQEANLLLG